MRRFAVGLGVAFALAAVLASVPGRGDKTNAPSFAERIAKNYRVLTKAQSRELIQYAENVHGCVVGHGGKVAAPVATRTRITMSAPGQSADDLLAVLMKCDPRVGPPPPKSSLQARRGRILVYVPKQCLLDPTEIDEQHT